MVMKETGMEKERVGVIEMGKRRVEGKMVVKEMGRWKRMNEEEAGGEGDGNGEGKMVEGVEEEEGGGEGEGGSDRDG